MGKIAEWYMLSPPAVRSLVLAVLVMVVRIQAQTEGDTGYDYQDAYDDEFDDDAILGLEPTFDVPIVNVTVVAGQMALLPCSIDYLGKYKVTWVDHRFIPLSYEDRRVIDDPRFSIVRPYIKEWNLQIRDVTWEDQGQYRCTVNTDPVKSKIVMLHVKVPAQIIDELSSNDVTVQEGDTVVLTCNVTGVPKPEVTWYRRPHHSDIAERQRIQEPMGEIIIISNVSRYCDDIYECVADNGVPPAISRQMRVTVEFPPEIQMTNSRIGQVRGKETILECRITAFPLAVNIWEKDNQRVTSSSRHRIDAYDEGEHTITLSLRIHDISGDDYGKYTCVAANLHGRDQEHMWLYEVTKNSRTTTTPRVIYVGAHTPYPPYTHQNKPKKPKKPGVDENNSGPVIGGQVTGAASTHYYTLLQRLTLACLSLLLSQCV